MFAWPSEGNFVNNRGGMTKRGGNIEWKSRCVSLDFSCAMCIYKLSCLVKVIFFIIIKEILKNYIWLKIRYHGYDGFASANFSKLLALYDLQFIYLESQTIHHNFFGT